MSSRPISPARSGATARTPREAVTVLAPLLAGSPDRERVAACFVGRGGAILAADAVAEGGAVLVPLPVTALLARAVRLGATGLIVAHTHPGGDPEPSLADIRATRRLALGAALVGVALTDHLVLAGEAWRSFRLMGLL